MISSLKYAISRDRDYFVKAMIDPMYKGIRPQVSSLLNNILEETKKNAQNQVTKLERDTKKMDKWFSGNYASSEDIQRYSNVKNKIQEIHHKLSLNSYFDYDDALKISYSANEELDKIQLSIKETLKYLESSVKSNEIKLKDISNESFNELRKYRKDILTDAFAAIFIPLILIYGSSWYKNFFFSHEAYRSGLFIIGGLLAIPLLGGAGYGALFTLGFFLDFFGKIKENASYKKKVGSEEEEITKEIITLTQKITIAKESII